MKIYLEFSSKVAESGIEINNQIGIILCYAYGRGPFSTFIQPGRCFVFFFSIFIFGINLDI